MHRRLKYCSEPVWDKAGLYEAILLLHPTPALCHLRHEALLFDRASHGNFNVVGGIVFYTGKAS